MLSVSYYIRDLIRGSASVMSCSQIRPSSMCPNSFARPAMNAPSHPYQISNLPVKSPISPIVAVVCTSIPYVEDLDTFLFNFNHIVLHLNQNNDHWLCTALVAASAWSIGRRRLWGGRPEAASPNRAVTDG